MEETSSQNPDLPDGIVGSHLAGHLVLERLGSSQESTVFRARTKDGSGTVVLKVVDESLVGKEAAARLKFEYELLSSVDLKASTRPVSFQRAPGLSILVMEDFRGIDLRVFARRSPMGLDSFFTLAIGIVSGLAEIHDAMVIHQDIKPPNILVSPEDLRVQIIDFSIATKLTRREPSLRDIQHLKGTPAYIAPEQTGAMNRSLDYRCDLYSLGATFYYMLSGQPPFRRKGLWEYVRAHIADTPIKLTKLNEDVPDVLADIINKLLSKYPEERYQSATGLRFDLEKTKEQWQQTNKVEPFMLGVKDVPSRFEIPERLYGRDETIACIQDTFEKARASGRTEFIMLHGAPGVGKTAVVREVYKTLVRYGGISTTGKFDQFSRAVPYLGFSQAFDGWVDYIEDTSLDNQTRWKRTLRGALGKNTDLMAQLSPKLSRFVGEVTHRDNLDHLANRDRFDVTVSHFIDAITPEEQPLVLFLDDMQWADQGSLDLLSKLVTSPQKRHLLIIGSYRDNEAAATLRMQNLVEQTKQAGGNTHSIGIGPLFEDDVLKLLENTLHTKAEKCRGLGKLLMNKTNGNAFFLRQLLTRLYEDHVINFDSQNAQWLWNIKEINSHPVSANVVSLMIDKLKQLPDKTQQLLRAASCMGNQFDLRILSLVSQISIQDAGQLLWHALNEGVLIAFSDKTKFFQPGMLESLRDPTNVANSTTDTWLSKSEDIKYRFVHDAVQEAAHAMLEMDEEQQTKLRWARVIQADAGEKQLDEVLINMMQAFNVSAQRIESPEECLTLARLNLKAGRRCRDSKSYDAAVDFIKDGIWFTGRIGESDPALLFQLELELAALESIRGNIEKSDKLLEELLNRSVSDNQKREIWLTRLEQHINLGRTNEAIEDVVAGLSACGMSISAKPGRVRVGIERLMAASDLKSLDTATDPANKPIVPLNDILAFEFMTIALGAVYRSQPQLMAILILRSMRLIARHGQLDGASYAFVNFALLELLDGNFSSAERFGMRGLELANQGDEGSGRAYMVYASRLNHWFHDARDSLNYYYQAYIQSLENGDYMWADHALSELCLYSIHLSNNLDDILQVERDYGYLVMDPTSKRYWYFSACSTLMKNVHAALTQGVQDFDNFLPLGAERKAWIKEAQRMQALVLMPRMTWEELGMPEHFQFSKTLVLYIFGEYQRALECSSSINSSLHQFRGTLMVPYHAFFHALIQARLYEDMTVSEQKRFTRQLRSTERFLSQCVDRMADNFKKLHTLVAAELARITRDFSRADHLYQEALSYSMDGRYLWVVGITGECAARFYLERKEITKAVKSLHIARNAYTSWGASEKVRRLEFRYPEFFGPRRDVENPLSHDTAITTIEDTGLGDELITVDESQESVTMELEVTISQNDEL